MRIYIASIALVFILTNSYAQRRLELHPKVGTIVHGHMKVDMEMSMMGKDMTNLMNSYITYKIDSIDENGNITITHTVDSIIVNIQADENNIDINSNIPSTYEDNAQFAPIMSTVGQSFTNKFDKYGKSLTVQESSMNNNGATMFVEYLPLDKKNSWELETETEMNGMKVKSQVEYTWKNEEAGKVYLACKTKSSVMGMKINAPSDVIIDANSGLVISNIGTSQNNMMGMKMKTTVIYIATIE
jgi:hypothetical protein